MIDNGNLTQENVQELVSEQKQEVQGMGQIVRSLTEATELTEEQIQMLAQIIQNIGNQELSTDKEMNNIDQILQEMAENGVSSGLVQNVLGELDQVADRIKQEARLGGRGKRYDSRESCRSPRSRE